MPIFVLVASPLSPSIGTGFFSLVPVYVAGVLWMAILLRFGLLTVVVSTSVALLLQYMPLTLDTSSWYASTSFLTVAACLAVAAYGFWFSLAGRPLMGAVLDD